ncbi:MAG: sensor histidine kinase [Elusimicrobiaceae bacterium]|nr:sensor histidine kinase [Elusimicrobiaceae bacterium]
MAEKKKQKTCIYSTPQQCGELARFVGEDRSLSSVKEEGVEGYDLVYIADIRQKQIVLFGTPKGTQSAVSVDPVHQVHQAAHEKAAQGEVVSYEWSACNEQNSCFFQSTLIPLRDKEGKIGSVLGLVKNITDWAHTYSQEHFLKEVSRRTFPQVLLMAREEERRQLSSALHDEIGSSAVILTSLLSMVKESVKGQDQAQALKDIEALDKQIKNSIERVKNIVVGMRPPNLEAVGLEDAMRDMVENAARYGGLKHRFEVETADDTAVSDEVKIVLYRVVQESLNNILKHAHATAVEVRFKRGTQDVTLTIQDNGCGFVQTEQRSIEHIGLLSMKDSVAYLGGKFTITSEPGKGTQITVTCPKVVYGEIQR